MKITERKLRFIIRNVIKENVDNKKRYNNVTKPDAANMLCDYFNEFKSILTSTWNNDFAWSDDVWREESTDWFSEIMEYIVDRFQEKVFGEHYGNNETGMSDSFSDAYGYNYDDIREGLLDVIYDSCEGMSWDSKHDFNLNGFIQNIKSECNKYRSVRMQSFGGPLHIDSLDDV